MSDAQDVCRCSCNPMCGCACHEAERARADRLAAALVAERAHNHRRHAAIVPDERSCPDAICQRIRAALADVREEG